MLFALAATRYMRIAWLRGLNVLQWFPGKIFAVPDRMSTMIRTVLTQTFSRVMPRGLAVCLLSVGLLAAPLAAAQAADNAAIKRGFQVTKEVCSACHGLSLVRFGDLTDAAGPALRPEEAEALAQQYVVPLDGKDAANGTRPATLEDAINAPFPSEADAKAAMDNRLPLDLSLIGTTECSKASFNPYAKAPQPAKHVCGPELLTKWLASNGHSMIGLPYDALAEGQIFYEDGTAGTVWQYAIDVGAFAAWAATVAEKNLGGGEAPQAKPDGKQGPIHVTPAAAAAGSVRVALVLGNGGYTRVAGLPNATSDADLIAGSLRKAGFSDVIVAKDLTRAAMVDTLRAFRDKADRADWAVVYFAGHGIEAAGRNYLIPVDATLKDDRDIEAETVPLDEIMKAVSGARQLRFIALDACRTNPFEAQMKRQFALRSTERGLARIEPTGATLIVYSAKDGTVALDGDGANSPFATALAKRLVEPGVEINKVLRFVRDDVLTQTGSRQEPYVYGSLPPDDFFFVTASKE